MDGTHKRGGAFTAAGRADASEYRAFAEHVHVMDVKGPPAEGYYKRLKELVLDQANSSEAEVIRLDQVTCDLSPGDGRWRWVTRETILHKFELWSAGGANWGPTIQLCGSDVVVVGALHPEHLHRHRINGKRHCNSAKSAQALWQKRPDLRSHFAKLAQQNVQKNEEARNAFLQGVQAQPAVMTPCSNAEKAKPEANVFLLNGVRLHINTVLGQGTDGLALEFALKLYKCNQAGYALVEAGKEFQFFRDLRGSPFVLDCYGAVANSNGNTGLLLPLASMSLANLLQKKDHPTPAIPTITQLLCGLVHLCEREVLHCDLKPSNILAMPDGRFVITDFGLAKRLHGGRVTTHGNFCYSMPYRPVEALAAGKDQAGPCPYQKLVQLNKLEHSCFLCP
ncbi:unnamed protein product [Cladocopium goreaui]|uniref:mitogen-activated protein kinase kinase n=1 Tax=Cladocopium goreaui TaxID=2562237 RepID=A0A9P1DIY6_9DINO|nr:unnamed protein product [Cladocopium goreaui]